MTNNLCHCFTKFIISPLYMGCGSACVWSLCKSFSNAVGFLTFDFT